MLSSECVQQLKNENKSKKKWRKNHWKQWSNSLTKRKQFFNFRILQFAFEGSNNEALTLVMRYFYNKV